MTTRTSNAASPNIKPRLTRMSIMKWDTPPYATLTPKLELCSVLRSRLRCCTPQSALTRQQSVNCNGLPLVPGKFSKLISLPRLILDGHARRFKAQKIYYKAAAAMKWIDKRNSILQGQKPRNCHIPQLQQADNTLRNVRRASNCSRRYPRISLNIRDRPRPHHHCCFSI